MPLHPQAKSLLDLMNQAPSMDMSQVSPEQMRGMFSAMSSAALVTGPGELDSVQDREVPGASGDITVRVYRPKGDGPMPCLMFFHGGGFVICDLDTHDSTCRALAAGAGCTVISVDYRLAPEAPFPAAPEDCFAATVWAHSEAAALGIDPSRIAVGGDSAGGNLAAVVSFMCRDRGGPELVHQLLVYPVTDYAFDTVSYRDNSEGYMLTTDMMRWFWDHYLVDEADGAEPLASPLRAEICDGLPPATVITAGFDPLRDEGEAYAKKLEAAGIPTRYVHYEGMFHGFFAMGDQLDEGRAAVDLACTELRTAFGSGGSPR